MAGLSLNSGLGASVFTGGYPGAATPAASIPTAQGPTSIGQKAFGVVTGDEGAHPLGFWSSTLGGALALGLLVFIWWSLPRLGGGYARDSGWRGGRPAPVLGRSAFHRVREHRQGQDGLIMRFGGLTGLALAIVVAVAVADLVAHPQGTQVLTKSAVRAQTVALNAELGKTS